MNDTSKTINRPPSADENGVSPARTDSKGGKGERLTEGEAVVSGNIRVVCSLSTNAVEAYITVRTPPNTSVPIEMIQEALQREKVTVGLMQDVIEDLSRAKGKRGVPVLVAKGNLSGGGTDARVEYFFETEPKPKIKVSEKDGRVDYREAGIIQQVNEGQLLAIKTPAMPGESGISVTGVMITGKTGTDVPLLRGQGTHFEDEDKLRLIAEIPGSAKLRGNGEVEVSSRHIVDGDIDFETGNVRFNGSVIVKGSVRAGFEVVATHDIEIQGVVEDAMVHCGGNLLLRGGFIGQGKGLIKVGGETHIKFVEGQTVYGNHDVYIAEEIIHANVISGGRVIVKFGKGAIIGGKVFARDGINAKILGNIHYVRTHLRTGTDPHLDQQLQKIAGVINNKQIMKEKTQAAINVYVQKKYAESKGLSTTEEEHLKYLYHVMSHYDEWSKYLANKYEKLIEEREHLDLSAFVIAEQQAHPGVFIEVAMLQRKLDKEFRGVAFKVKDRILTALRPIGHEGEYKLYEGEGAES
ncbi:MAG: FapA family protein [bacterium]